MGYRETDRQRQSGGGREAEIVCEIEREREMGAQIDAAVQRDRN